jgi:hypothetical protein
MFRRIKNIFLNALRYKDSSIIIQKIKDKFESNKTFAATNWAKENKIDLENFCKSKDDKIWKESLIELDEIEKNKLDFKVFAIKNEFVGLVENIGLQLKENFKKKF